MFSDNSKISAKQLNKLLIIELFSTTSLILPQRMTREAGGLGWISLILGAIGVLLYGFLIVYVGNRLCESTRINKFWRLLLGFAEGFFFVKFMLTAIFIVNLFAWIINLTLLPNTPRIVVMLVILLASAGCAAKGIEVRARVAELFFWVIIIPVILLIVFAASKFEAKELVQLGTKKASGFFSGAAGVIIAYQAVEIMLFAPAHVIKKARDKIVLTKAVGTVTVLNVALFITTISVLGIDATLRQKAATVSIMQVVNFTSPFMERQDVFLLSFWIISIFIVLNMYLYYLSVITSRNGEKGTKLAYLYAAVIFFVSIFVADFEYFESIYIRLMLWIGLPAGVAIIAIAAVALKVGETNEVN